MHQFHAVVWMDHREAKVFEIGPDEVEKFEIHSKHAARQVHHKSGSIGAGHAGEDEGFLKDIADHLGHAGAVLIVGPGQAKTHLMKFLGRKHAAIADKVVAVETVDHPTDGQIVAYARRYFRASDRMRPQLG